MDFTYRSEEERLAHQKKIMAKQKCNKKIIAVDGINTLIMLGDSQTEYQVRLATHRLKQLGQKDSTILRLRQKLMLKKLSYSDS